MAMVDLESDPEFRIHTSYHSDFFVLRTEVKVNGESTDVKESGSKGPVLIFRRSSNTITTLRQIANTIAPVLRQYGVCHVDMFYYEHSPLLHVVFSSKSCLVTFLIAISEVKSALEGSLLSLFPHDFTVEVQPELYLVSPSQGKTKGAELYRLTTDNCSSLVARWKKSNLFDFGPLYQVEAQPPRITSQPTDFETAPPDMVKGVVFTVKATGTEPVSYQWQSALKPAEADWQMEDCDASTLKLDGVKPSNTARYYRCVVSNSVGCEISRFAYLIAGADLPDLVEQLEEVIDWVPFGLYLGVKKSKLDAIEKDYATTRERRLQMLSQWGNQVVPTWSAVIEALVRMGMRRLASKLAEKHGIPMPEQLAVDQLPGIFQPEGVARPELLPKIQQYREIVFANEEELAKTKKQLTDTQKSEEAISETTSQLQDALSKAEKKAKETDHETDLLRVKLQSKERECELLSDIRGLHKQIQEKGEACERINRDYKLLEEMINRKEKKISQLKEKLRKKESELKYSQDQIKALQKELTQAQEELRKKQEEMEKLQLKMKKLAHSCDIGRQYLCHLVQGAVAPTSEPEFDEFPDPGLDFDDLPDMGDSPDDGSPPAKKPRRECHFDPPWSEEFPATDEPPDVTEKDQISTDNSPAESQSRQNDSLSLSGLCEQLQIRFKQQEEKLQAKDVEIIEMKKHFKIQLEQKEADLLHRTRISSQTACTEVQNGPTSDARWNAGLDLNVDQKICGDVWHSGHTQEKLLVNTGPDHRHCHRQSCSMIALSACHSSPWWECKMQDITGAGGLVSLTTPTNT